jgi:SAM-dependent methyltransferase
MLNQAYVHGYSNRETTRLLDQAHTLASLLHSDTSYPEGSVVLEAGCGVGAQTAALARSSPKARIIAVDRSPESLALARRRIAEQAITNVEFVEGDLLSLSIEPHSVDHVFICFVLEHVTEPSRLLQRLLVSLKPGGTLCAIEGDHGSAFFYPDSVAAHRAIDCLVQLQRRSGGDPCIGRRLYPLLTAVGLREVRVSPRFVYADASRPSLVSGFTIDTFTAMVEGVRDSAIAASLCTPYEFDDGLMALRRCADVDGTFCYTFFKATGVKAP